MVISSSGQGREIGGPSSPATQNRHPPPSKNAENEARLRRERSPAQRLVLPLHHHPNAHGRSTRLRGHPCRTESEARGGRGLRRHSAWCLPETTWREFRHGR